MEELKRKFMETIADFGGDATRYDIDQPITLINNYGSNIVIITAVCHEDEGIIIAQTNNEVEAIYRFNFEARICVMEKDNYYTDPECDHIASNVLSDILGPLLNDNRVFTWVNRPIRIDTSYTPKNIKDLRVNLEEEFEDDDE